MDWIALIFWTVDVLFSFVTGYYYNGQLVLDPHKIAIHYLTTWFFLDIAVIVPEWLTMVAGSEALSFAGIGRALRLGKAMRVVRLLRVLKLRRILDAVLERIQSEFTFLLISLLRLLFFIVLLNHVIACLWYLIGKETLASEMVNWIQEGKYEDEDQTYKYFTSLHWALTQFTPASMNVSATNAAWAEQAFPYAFFVRVQIAHHQLDGFAEVYERIFSIAVLFFAMVAFSSIVGGSGSSKGLVVRTFVLHRRSNHMKQFWILRRYLKQNGVGKELQFRIEKFLEYQTAKEQEHVQPAMVAHLAKLSQPLKNELQYTIMVQWLRGHPFFSKICTHMPNFMHKLCSTAIKEKVLGSGDIVFEAGEECSQVYFLSAGLILEYTHIRETAETSNRLHSKQWISEPALWTPWKHLGVCEAEKPGEIISVDTATFCKEMSAHPAPKSLCAAYARLFVECLNSMPKHTMSDVLDQTILDVSAIVEKASHVAAALGYSTTSNSVALNSPSSAQL
ncbi:KCNH7 [Symbiodinium sp. CCMP2592]|nr:KCNH7 [Symbiodinium sp. CCMP2592]